MQDQWFEYELLGGAKICPTHYEIRVPPYDKIEGALGANHLRVWRLEASNDGKNFVTVTEHRLEAGYADSVYKTDGSQIRWIERGHRFEIKTERENMQGMAPAIPSYGIGVVTLNGEASRLEGGKVVNTLQEVDWEAEQRAVHPVVAINRQKRLPGLLEGKAAGYDPTAFYTHFRIVARDQVGLSGFELYGTLVKPNEEDLKSVGK